MSICRGLLVCASLESILIVGGRESIHVPVGIWLFVSTYTIAVELVSMHVPLFLAGLDPPTMSASKFNLNNPAVKRILQEVKEMQSNPSDDYMSLPLEVLNFIPPCDFFL